MTIKSRLTLNVVIVLAVIIIVVLAGVIGMGGVRGKTLRPHREEHTLSDEEHGVAEGYPCSHGRPGQGGLRNEPQ